jgi:hypothetical protein
VKTFISFSSRSRLYTGPNRYRLGAQRSVSGSGVNPTVLAGVYFIVTR